MTSELLDLFDYYEKAKGIDRQTMIEAVSNALLTASRKSAVGQARELRVDIDEKKGTIKAIARLIVVEKVTQPYDEIELAMARRISPDAQVGEEIDVEVTPKDFGRIAAQTAKQAIMQRIRQAEKAMMYDEFKDRVGEIVAGTVRRFEKSDVIIDLGKFEAVMPQRERVSTEDYNVGDRIRAYVVAVENQARGPEIILSRSHPNFVRRLFEFEVSEIADRTVELKSIAREAGYRTKVAVHSEDGKVDPVGACVGLRGARVKNIVRELNNEKVDIIRYSEDVEDFVRDALKPATLVSVGIDEENRLVKVTVPEDELSKAIGRKGQNARLTARLIGWDVKVEKDESAQEMFEQKVAGAAQTIADALEIDVETATTLTQNGMVNLNVMAGADAEDIAEILEIDEAEAAKLLARAKEKAQG